MCDPSFLDCLKYDFMRQLCCDVKCEIDCFCMYRVIWLFPNQYLYFVLWATCDNTNAHTMGICCVLLEPINVAYLLQCIAILKHFLLTRGLTRGSPSHKRHFGITVIRRMLCQRFLNESALSKGVNSSLRGKEGILTP